MSKKKQRYTLSKLRWTFVLLGSCEMHEAKGCVGSFQIARWRIKDGWTKWYWDWEFQNYSIPPKTVDSLEQGMNECNAKHREMMLPHLTPVTN